MLLGKKVLEKVVRGEVTLVLRRWKRPTVKSGGRLRTSVGVLRIGAVTPFSMSDLTEAEARSAGYSGREAAIAELAGEERGALYRIELDGVEPDARASLRTRTKVAPEEWTAIAARFERWEKASPGRHRAILAVIRERPETAAGVLADALDLDKPSFKQEVRKLKELGLTESLDIGYRLSPRGNAVLDRLADRT